MDTKKNHIHYLNIIHHVSSGNDYILLQGSYGGLGAFFFNDRHMEYPIDDSINSTSVFFGCLLLQTPCVCDTVNTFKNVFCGSGTQLFFCSMKQIDRNILNKIKINVFLQQFHKQIEITRLEDYQKYVMTKKQKCHT